MALITIESMEFYAYHGCFEEEQIIGNRFIVDIVLQTDTSEAEKTDDLSKTVNYQKVFQIIQKEMEIKSKLLEHLAHRIADAVYHTFPAIQGLTVKVSKLNPPIGGKVDRVSVMVKKGFFNPEK